MLRARKSYARSKVMSTHIGFRFGSFQKFLSQSVHLPDRSYARTINTCVCFIVNFAGAGPNLARR